MKSSCLVIAGEKSGEEHAMTFFPELKKQVGDVEFYGVGGDLLQREGVELLYHLNDFNAFGFSEAIKKLPYFIRAFNRILKEVDERKTKTAILIDFQDFNLRLAKKLKERGVKVMYYVAPTAWIWKAWRAEALAQSVHTLFTIYPFEKEWFHSRGVERVLSVPHPLWLKYKDDLNVDLSIDAKPFSALKQNAKIVLLPGSRRFEVKFLMPVYFAAIKELKNKFNLTISLVKSASIDEALIAPYRDIIDNEYRDDEIVSALKDADLAVAASGTVTLTTALFELPTVVCYRLSPLNALIYRAVIRYYGPVSMANLIFRKMVFPELLQEKFTVKNLVAELQKLLTDEGEYQKVKGELSKTSSMLRFSDLSVGEYIGHVISEDRNV